MNIARIAIEKRTITLVLSLLTVIGGFLAYQGLPRLEDPEFTIKEALVITPYPGATPAEVEEEVTDELEKAVQKLGELEEVESRSERGLSTLTVRILKRYDKDTLPQIWDELRRKVNDAQRRLPPGAGPSLVVDDFGDVYSVFLAVYGEGYSHREVRQFVEILQRELLLVQDVAKVELFANQREAVYVELDRDRLSQLGLSPGVIINELQQKNLVSDAGRVRVGPEFITLDPTGQIDSLKDFESILISSRGAEEQIFLGDVATIRRDYVDPPNVLLNYDGSPAIGIAISTVPGGNVVTMGEALQRRLSELEVITPIGMEIAKISYQSDAVTESIQGFVINLAEAVGIVIAVLMIFMGLRSALIIGFVLVLTVTGTFIIMSMQDVALQRISLGALVIALGMLVDNAIVVIDGMLMKIRAGVDRKRAAEDVVNQTAIPLLGATVVAVLAFAAIGTSDHSTGEFTRSLYQVVAYSLLFSWVTGITVTPLLGVMFLKAPEKTDGDPIDPYSGGFYGRYKSLLGWCINRRAVTVIFVLVAFGSALWGFGYVDKSFFPNSTRPQFMVDYWLPQGTHINDTAREVQAIENHIMGLEGVTHVTSVIGQGAPRFVLTYSPEKKNSAYAQFLVDVDDYRIADTMRRTIEVYLAENHPQGNSYTNAFILGPSGGGKIQARVRGPNPDVLRRLVGQIEDILRNDGGAKAIRTDWRQRVKVVRPVIAEDQANINGITREQIARTIREFFEGVPVGVFREGDELLPITLRAPADARLDIANLASAQIWSQTAGRMIPLRQVVPRLEVDFEDPIVIRLDRIRTLTIHADQTSGVASTLFNRIRPPVEALDFPPGYRLEWGGEFEDSGEAQEALGASLPYFFVMMVLIVIMLFNALRQPLIIWLTVPLALIGVTGGLLLTSQPFGFMSLLGFMSLSGMLIKNAIVLIDQIDLEIREGKERFLAILDSGASRLRPVSMAALTTALGMLPLLTDAFFVAMAVTIIAGLVFATGLTMVVVPVLYALFFRIYENAPTEEPAAAPQVG